MLELAPGCRLCPCIDVMGDGAWFACVHRWKLRKAAKDEGLRMAEYFKYVLLLKVCTVPHACRGGLFWRTSCEGWQFVIPVDLEACTRCL